ncbi:MAG: hypothetical protein REI95_13965, partial [Oxalicibacterium faecigallinarum]|uniref:hypothetical protein n=1 Tax=Oxalicibacterium faecigallinarum TaxID=573741 RepID=UPI0028099418
AHDFVSQSKIFEQTLKLGRLSEKDYVWITSADSLSSFYINTRTNDQKTQNYFWFNAESGAPSCTFSGSSSYHDKLNLFASGNQLFDQQCNPAGEVSGARNGHLYQLGDGWVAMYPSQGYKRQAFDAKGNLLTGDLYNDIQLMPQGDMLLFKDKELVRVLDRNGRLRGLSTLGGSYPRLHDDYLVWSNFDQGYKIIIARYSSETPIADFLQQQNKDEYETTAAYRQRITRLSAPFNRDVQLGTYNADNQILPVIIDNVTVDIRVPAAQAKRLKEQSSIRLQGKVKLLEPGIVEIVDGALSGGDVSFKIAAAKGSAR